jgi:hypothetical protein
MFSNPTFLATVGFTPSNIADLSITPGQNANFTVTVTNSTPIDGFAVFLHYNEQVLRVNTIDYSNNVLGSKAEIIEECVDHVSLVQGLLCTPLDNPGVISLTLSLLGNAVTPSNTTGVLFKVSFRVFGQGFSALHIIRAILDNGITMTEVALTTSDAYFTNIDCPSGSKILCRPPITGFTYSPIPSYIFRPTIFNASASRATNLQANISFLTWEFGDTGPIQNSTTGANGRPVPTIQHIYRYTGNFSVTLAVVDSYGITAYATVTVQVIIVYIDLLLSRVEAAPRSNVYPGTQVQISGTIMNNSTVAEPASVTISLDTGLVLGNENLGLMAPFNSSAAVGPITWDTIGYGPRVYRIDVKVAIIAGENITSNNVGSVYVQLVHSPDFVMNANPSTLRLTRGIPGAVTVAIAIEYGFTGTVSFADTAPVGLTCGTINPSSVTGSGTATLICSGTSVGNYTLTITGTNGSLLRSAVALLIIQDFSISATSPAAVVTGTSTTSTITLTSINHFSGPVALTDTVPSGLTCGAITPSILEGSGTATVSCSATYAGTYDLSIHATAESQSRSSTVIVTAESPPSKPQQTPETNPTIFALQPILAYSLIIAVSLVTIAIIVSTVVLTRRRASHPS